MNAVRYLETDWAYLVPLAVNGVKEESRDVVVIRDIRRLRIGCLNE